MIKTLTGHTDVILKIKKIKISGRKAAQKKSAFIRKIRTIQGPSSGEAARITIIIKCKKKFSNII